MKLTTKARKKIPTSNFGLPSERKYPMPDKNHARFAEAMASKEEKAGRISAGQKAEIDAKAKRKLKGK